MVNILNFDFMKELRREDEIAAKAATINQFDSAAADFAAAVESFDDKAFNGEILQLRREALFAVAELADNIVGDDLDDGELPSDRLDALLVGNIDGDDGDDLNEKIVQIKAANMADALSTFGVDEDTIEKMFSDNVDDADEAIERAVETIIVNLPEAEDRVDFINTFVFGDSGLDMEAGQVDQYDSATIGKTKVRKTKSGQTFVYKGVRAVRHGKVTVVNKRVGNTTMKMKLSPKQKAALRKASMKAVTPNAIKRRVKSLNIGIRQGIYKGNKGL